MNEILKNIRFNNIDNIRDVIKAAAILVSERVGVKRKIEQKQKDPFWKRRIENDIGKLRKDLSRIEAWFKGNWKNGKQQEKLDLKKKYSLKAKGFTTVMEKLKQRISAKKEKLVLLLLLLLFITTITIIIFNVCIHKACWYCFGSTSVISDSYPLSRESHFFLLFL